LGDATDAFESWYVDEIFAMTQAKRSRNELPSKLIGADKIPDVVATRMSSYLQEHHTDDSPVRVLITATPASDPTNFQEQLSTKFFHPTVLNYVGRKTDARANLHMDPDDEGNLEGYGICFINSDRSNEFHVIFDVVLMSDKPYDDEDGLDGKSKFSKDAHLTPLEQSLDESIRAANVVIREMDHMEHREKRMRQTAESINTRVRWFSYLSVSILLAVTYIQVSYLKRYFHKKKLM
jgi:p24 family protein delta-1